MKNKRVVVTGLGVISSIGFGIDNFWPALLAGKSGISKVETFDTSQTGNFLAGEIKNFNPIDFMSESTIENVGRTSQLAIASTKLVDSEKAVFQTVNIRQILCPVRSQQ